MFGFVAATKTDENFMSQVLEHVLLSKWSEYCKKRWNKKTRKRELKNSLEFYKKLAKASPPGELILETIKRTLFCWKNSNDNLVTIYYG